MTAHVCIDQTDTGWDVDVKEAENVLVRFEDGNIYVSVKPDDDDAATPLAVSLEAVA